MPGGAGSLKFASKARSHATGMDFHDYEVGLELYSEIETEESHISVTDRRVLLAVAKKADDTEYWPRLLKSKDKVANVKVDWSRWVDEDEEDEKKADFDLGDLQKYSNFDLGGAGAGAAGLNGAGAGLDEEDSDDEELPDLEPAQPTA